jgi:hypothetical protein
MPLFFVLFCGLTAHAPGSFLASRLCSFLLVSANALKNLSFLFQSVVLLRKRQAHFSPVVFVHFLRLSAIPFFHSVVLLRMRQGHSVSFRGGDAPQPVTSCSGHGSSFSHAGSGL